MNLALVLLACHADGRDSGSALTLGQGARVSRGRYHERGCRLRAPLPRARRAWGAVDRQLSL